MPDWQFVDTIFESSVILCTHQLMFVCMLNKSAESNELINSHITLECGRQINDAKNIFFYFIHEKPHESGFRDERHTFMLFREATNVYVCFVLTCVLKI